MHELLFSHLLGMSILKRRMIQKKKKVSKNRKMKIKIDTNSLYQEIRIYVYIFNKWTFLSPYFMKIIISSRCSRRYHYYLRIIEINIITKQGNENII